MDVTKQTSINLVKINIKNTITNLKKLTTSIAENF